MASNTTARALFFAICLVASAVLIRSFVKDSLIPFKAREYCCILSSLHSILSSRTTSAVGLAAFVVFICSLGKYFLPCQDRGCVHPSPDLTVAPDYVHPSDDLAVAPDYVHPSPDLTVAPEYADPSPDLAVAPDYVEHSPDLIVAPDYVDPSPVLIVAPDYVEPSPDLTVVINQETWGEMYSAAEGYLSSNIALSTTRLRVTKQEADRSIAVTVDIGEEVLDIFEGIHLRWKLVHEETVNSFELTFNQQHKDMVLEKYLKHVLNSWMAVKETARPLKLHMLQYFGSWSTVDLVHPAMFDTVAMEPDLKCTVVEDLDRIFKSDYCKRIGELRKRGYLLRGPRGTAKWSLIAAMANYLNFDIYNLNLTKVLNESITRTLLLETTNRSILVVDGDEEGDITLSDVFNVIDEIWSSCGDERIFVLTTNGQKPLDPTLLQPGRMDVYVDMSYCKSGVFRSIVKNYYGVENHPTFPEIERMLEGEVDVTPAEVRGKLLGRDNVDVALAMLVEYLEEEKKEQKTKLEEEDSRECHVEKINDGEANEEEIEQ